MLVSCVVACLCSIVRGSSAGLLEFPDFWYLETFNAAAEDHSEPDHDHSHQLVLAADQSVVTAVDLRDNLRLRPATGDETERFEGLVEPIVLTVSATKDRGQELADATEDENNPTVTVLFKGDYSVISITCERQVWYFVIRPPSPLPNWFHSEHRNPVGTGPAMDIPEEVQKEFYVTLLRLLKVFLRFDL